MTEDPRPAAARTLLVDWNAANVMDSLADKGIPSILLKGPTLAKWLYEGAGSRHYADADVLVPDPQLGGAEQVLTTLGFVRIPSLPHGEAVHAHAWKKGPAAIDLHCTLGGAGADPARVWDILSRHVVKEEIAGRTLPCLDLDARAMHVVLHAAWHGSAVGKPIEDLRRLLGKMDAHGWAAVYSLAAEIDALPAFGAGLGLTQAGLEVAAGLGLDAEAGVETILRASSAAPYSLWFNRLVEMRTWKKRAAFLWHTAFPPRDFMLQWSPMARRGPFGLVLAYACRPFWKLRRLWLAVSDYVRARRLARGRR